MSQGGSPFDPYNSYASNWGLSGCSTLIGESPGSPFVDDSYNGGTGYTVTVANTYYMAAWMGWMGVMAWADVGYPGDWSSYISTAV